MEEEEEVDEEEARVYKEAPGFRPPPRATTISMNPCSVPAQDPYDIRSSKHRRLYHVFCIFTHVQYRLKTRTMFGLQSTDVYVMYSVLSPPESCT